MTFLERLNQPRPFVLDGGMGTTLFRLLPDYKGNLELLNLEKGEIIRQIYTSYVESGAEIITTNTFGGSRLKLAESGLADQCTEINRQAVLLAKNINSGHEYFVGGSIGPSGRLIQPVGDTPVNEVYDSFALQARGLVEGGADCIIIETMTDLLEAKTALMAVKDNTDLPVICSTTFETNAKTITGTDVVTGLATLSGCGATVAAINCSMGPEGLLKLYSEHIEELRELGIHLGVWANAGLPEILDGRAVYRLSPGDFAEIAAGFVDLGVKIIGGCCGTTPDHIRALRNRIKDMDSPYSPEKKNFCHITSRYGSLNLKKHSGLIIIGERLNPTARKKFAEDLKSGSQSFLREESKKQESEGAHVLDINVGLAGINETEEMERAVQILSTGVKIPLMIDSDNPDVLIRAVDNYPGIGIINSVNGKEKSIASILPIVKRSGFFIMALCLDESGIHRDAARRIEIGERLVQRLNDEGIVPGRIFIDPLMLAESAEPGSAAETLKVIEHFSKRGIKTSLGLSNISFGLPSRKHVNTVYLNMALEKGLTAAIVNPAGVNIIDDYSTEEQLAAGFLTGKDPGAKKYISHFSTTEKSGQAADKPPVTGKETDIIEHIYTLVVDGNMDEIQGAVKAALESRKPEDIMNRSLIRALEKVGDLYDTGEYFLPQMVASADAMKKGFVLLKPLLASDSGKKTGSVVICTVQGDVHDIGKNIVAMMLENHGFEVHDIGKDVPNEKVIESVREIRPDILCLSSLLTTTMKEMKAVSDQLRNAGLAVNLMVGGAVVTEEYAKSIGAHYAVDAVAGARKAKELVGA